MLKVIQKISFRIRFETNIPNSILLIYMYIKYLAMGAKSAFMGETKTINTIWDNNHLNYNLKIITWTPWNRVNSVEYIKMFIPINCFHKIINRLCNNLYTKAFVELQFSRVWLNTCLVFSLKKHCCSIKIKRKYISKYNK